MLFTPPGPDGGLPLLLALPFAGFAHALVADVLLFLLEGGLEKVLSDSARHELVVRPAAEGSPAFEDGAVGVEVVVQLKCIVHDLIIMSKPRKEGLGGNLVR